MLKAHPLELAILNWLGAGWPQLQNQLQQAQVIAREFTNGGGVFVKLAVPAPCEPALDLGQILDGPEIHSPELQHGALVTLWLTGGQIDCLEIWSCGSNYPADRHPDAFTLLEARMKRIDLKN